MTRGYDQPLYILPFDHRNSYERDVFGFHEPLTAPQIAQVAESKQLIYDGFKQALAAGAPREHSGILVDEEFGADILRDAHARQLITAMPTEKSGQHEFDFQYGNDFGKHIDEFDPTFTKVLVRYNPEGDAEMNRRQSARLKQISEYLGQHKRMFMFELLVPAEPAQLAKLTDKKLYDTQLRPGLMVRAIEDLQNAGIEPDVWKIEGLDAAADCQRIVDIARRGGRNRVGCIVLGRGENEQKVVEWLSVAASVPGFIGFAVGRSTFLQAIIDWHAGHITREAAVSQIAERFRHWIDVFQKAKKA